MNRSEINNVKDLLDKTVIGSLKAQVFGVMLVIYGAILGYFV